MHSSSVCGSGSFVRATLAWTSALRTGRNADSRENLSAAVAI
jgi:hypothetical protein